MQKQKMQEKEEQGIQLAKDRADLLTKLTWVQELVTKLVNDKDSSDVNSMDKTLDDASKECEVPEKKVSDMIATSMEKDKILELISEIGTGSNQMMARCENFEPWFWENLPGKVMTV